MRRPVDVCVKRLSLNSHKPRDTHSGIQLRWPLGDGGAFDAVDPSVEISSFFFLGGPHHFNFADYSSSALFVTCFLFKLSHIDRLWRFAAGSVSVLAPNAHGAQSCMHAAQPRSIHLAPGFPLSSWLQYLLGFSFWMSCRYFKCHCPPHSLSQWVIPTTFYPSIQPLGPEYDSYHINFPSLKEALTKSC